jgi:hypothetical protein
MTVGSVISNKAKSLLNGGLLAFLRARRRQPFSVFQVFHRIY